MGGLTCISQEKEYNLQPIGMMNYSETIAYLHSLTDYEKTRIERYTPETLDLLRVERLLAVVGDPHTQFPTIHIAGTKGKGSTAALCEVCLRAAGYRTGLFTSPHLYTFCERIQVDGQNISRDQVIALADEIRRAIERVPGVTTFEAITAMGFIYFARAEVDVAIVEVGLGGRLDATNVLTPEVSVITSLSLDHTYLLGDTLAEIAYEKAGIIKPGIPVVSEPQRAEASQVLETISRERGSPLTQVGRDWQCEPGHADLDGQTFTVRCVAGGGSELDGEYWMPLLGRYQLENGTSAIAALNILNRQEFHISAQAVREGFRAIHWPGRFEILSHKPVIVGDCAHNPYSAQVLRGALQEWFPDRRWVLIFGASVDKDIAGILRALLPVCEHVIVTRSAHPRASGPIELADIVASVGGGAEVSVNVKKSLRRGLAMVGPGSGLLVTGSIFLVADVCEEWSRYNNVPSPDNDNVEGI